MSASALVLVEHLSAKPRRACLEALGKARELGLDTIAFIAGKDRAAISGVAAALAPHASMVLEACHEALDCTSTETLVELLAAVVKQRAPAIVLGPATLSGRDALARLSARLGSPYAAEIAGLGVAGPSSFLVLRSVLGGKAIAEIVLEGSDGSPCVATVRSGTFPLPVPSPEAHPARVEPVLPVIDASGLRVRLVSFEETSSRLTPLAEAEIVLSGGRGLGEASRFALLEKVATRLNAAVGASRAVVDSGWRDVSDQVGKSGRTVAPRLYIAFGISGAVHHVMGMSGSGTVVAVNSDPNASFFKHADVGIIADVALLLPALVEEIGA